jgi:NADH:ubiquinone oxidoreductase subunit H
MGAVRAASQMVSYEVAMGLSIIAHCDDWNVEFKNCSTTIRNALERFLPTTFLFYIFNLCLCRNK